MIGFLWVTCWFIIGVLAVLVGSAALVLLSIGMMLLWFNVASVREERERGKEILQSICGLDEPRR